ncbi:polygalacturonase-like, partial [Vigna umbellata]|uniref:polygalacturonase-like n=1 Tax=Vigna umbellata TaxID=87088 RepID=UPI001F5F6B0B
MHVSFEESKNVIASGLTVTAPEDSPNTDGIHITNTQNIQISNTVIGTGDDCISIESGSMNVLATKITCGPGHGISIGSLGSAKSKDFVSGVMVNGAKFSGTTNGVRIKTWQGGSGSASNIKFQNIEMDKVTNPSSSTSETHPFIFSNFSLEPHRRSVRPVVIFILDRTEIKSNL